jgi:hypothetical protein
MRWRQLLSPFAIASDEALSQLAGVSVNGRFQVKIPIMRNRDRWTGVCIGLGFFLGVTGAGNPPPNAADWQRNVARVKTGIFEYRDSNRDKNVGRSTMTIQRLAGSGNLSFVNTADFSNGFSGFRSQRWDAVTSPEFRAILAKLAFLRGDETVPVFELSYGVGKATGFVVRRKASRQGIKETVDAVVPGDIVDQRIDWAAILASDLETGEHIEFNVFDPSNGVSRVTADVGASEELRFLPGRSASFESITRWKSPTGPSTTVCLSPRGCHT